MTKSPRLRTPFLLLILSLCVTGLLSGSGGAFAQTCSEGSPAKIADRGLWGSLQPGDVFEGNAKSDIRDTTDYTGNSLPGAGSPLYLSVDIENGWVFTSYASGARAWDTRTNPEKPDATGVIDIRTSGCTSSGAWPETPFCTELKHYFWDIDAPSGDDTVFAMTGITPVGFSILNSENKSSMKVVYQDTGKGSTPAGSQVYSATLNGRAYAFAVYNQGSTGIFLYDMTAADFPGAKCKENSNTEAGKCPNVFKGRIGNGTPAIYIDGVGTASGKHFIAASSQSFGSEAGIEIWNVSNPLAPVNVHSSGGRFLSNQFTGGVAMWEQGTRQYLATHVEGGAQIFDVTSCLASGCSSLGAPIWSGNWSTWGNAPRGADRLYVTFSRSGVKPMLYFGSNDQCSGGLQREFVFDVSNASAPVEISPDGTKDVNGKQVDYWGWYYSGNNPSTGFSRVMPMVAKFSGNVLYRAAQTVFDTHVWTNAAPTPPNANFTWSPTTVYSNQPITFTDTSTGNVSTRKWTFPNDASFTSDTASQVTVTFTQEGTKPVSLKAENAAGPDTETRNVEVLDPKPKFGSIGHAPQSPQTCQKVTFTAPVTGFPNPSVTWIVKDGNGNRVYPPGIPEGSQPYELPGNTLAAGPYTAVFTATNSAGTSTAPPHAFTISAPPTLSVGTPACTNCTSGSPEFGTVNLSVSSTGATGYSWDFGDGSGFRNEAQYNTATPTFSYGAPGTKTIRVKVLGCAGEQISQTLTVEIKNVNPLKINKFQAICAFNPCGFDTNAPINFEVNVSGEPTSYQFDWDGNGSFEDTTSKPDAQGIVTHSYSVAKTYKPVMKIVRGAESQTSPEHFPIVVSNGGSGGGGGGNNNPSISINGPTTGQPNVAVTFTASASNCTPSSTWTWDLAGGTANGSTSGNQVTVAWASTGAKTVSVTNSGCSGASGSRTIAINEPGGGGGGGTGGLGANFTWTPATPNAGQAVTFDGGSSTGSPSVYTWDFGGGVLKSGKTVTHTFAAPGPYTVKLEVGKQGDCALGFCSAVTSKQVTVGGPPPIAASFTTSANCVADFGPAICTAVAGQAVSFTSTSTGNPTTFSWNFGDGGTASGATATHTFQQAGTFTVTLTVGKDANTSSAARTFNVSPGSGEEPLSASFNTSATCNGNTCSAEAGQAVTFTSTSKGNPTSQTWAFSDGGTANGASVSHTFQQAGSFTVTLTIGKGVNSASTFKTFNVTAPPRPETAAIVLPWVAQSRGVLQQSSNLYIHNPGTTALEVTLEFRRQGTPEANPPRAALTIQPGATQYVVDVLKGLFKVENTIGFVTITKTKGDRDPVMTSFNNIAGKKGSQYGQTIPGVRMGNGAAASAGSRVQNLVGLSDNGDRQAYFGISNPNPQQAVYRLKFYDALGRPIGTPSGDLTLPSFGQRQYQLSEIRSLFGISTEDDYRVEVETVSGGNLYPYGTNVQTVSKDPTYQGVGRSKAKLYLIGAMRTKGLNKSEWQSDVVLANTGAQVALAEVSFLNAGPTAQRTAPFTLTLQPGQTERLENVGKQWNVKDSVGLITIESDAPNGAFPIVQGESYLATNGKAGARYGLAMAAFTDEDAAEAGEGHYLVGLKHDTYNRSTLWLYNPSGQAGTYDLIYRGLNGQILGRLDNVAVGAGKLRQFSPTQHPLKAVGKKSRGVVGGFTIEIVVKSGKALAAAQVVNNKTNDPAYVQGETR